MLRHTGFLLEERRPRTHAHTAGTKEDMTEEELSPLSHTHTYAPRLPRRLHS